MLAVVCRACQKKLSVREELAGKRVKCPSCGQAISVPTATPAKTVSPRGDVQATIAHQRPHSSEQPTHPPVDHSDATQESNSPNQDSSLTDFLAPPQRDDELGRLGGFRILKVLGHGGMGVVFLGEDANLGRKVAIKAMLPHLAASKTSQQRFLREAKAAATLDHDHIVPIFHVAEDRGAPYIVMPFLKGEPLDKRLHGDKILPLPQALRIGREVAEALAAAHQAGLIHRDIKPGNIWLESKDDPQKSAPFRVKVLDFGLARAASEQAGLTQSGAIVGTPSYMAPEQARGEKVDARCDLWSLGVVLYRMTTGQLPFVGTDSVSTLVAIAISEPRPPRELNPNIPVELATLIGDLLQKDIKRRLGTAAELVERLRVLETKGGPATVVPPTRTTTAPKRRRPWILAGAAGLFVFAIAILIVFLVRPPGPGNNDKAVLENPPVVKAKDKPNADLPVKKIDASIQTDQVWAGLANDDWIDSLWIAKRTGDRFVGVCTFGPEGENRDAWHVEGQIAGDQITFKQTKPIYETNGLKFTELCSWTGKIADGRMKGTWSRPTEGDGTFEYVLQKGWISLTANGLKDWKQDGNDWREVGDVLLDPKDDKRIITAPGRGTLVNNTDNRIAKNLFSQRSFGDVELHAEFLVPKRGNSGIFFLSHYELQIWDSFGATNLSAIDCGGVFVCELDGKPLGPQFGRAPRRNASRPFGEWQTFDALFRSPRFDADDKVTEPARFERVLLNGWVVQELAILNSPLPIHPPEAIFLQGGFGAIAFRNVRVRPLGEKKE